VFLVAFDGGSYGLTSRNSLALGVLWALVLPISLGLWPRVRVPAIAVLTAGFLAAFAGVTALSLLWADSAEKAFNEFNRVTLYLAVLALVLVAVGRGRASAWMAGLAVGMTAIGGLGLASRLFPGLTGETAQLAQLFPLAQRRLSYPVDYWNALATLIAFTLPLLIHFAVWARSALVRALALAPIPALAAALYLTSSRGGFVSSAIAAGAYLALTSRRWAAAAAALVAAAGCAATIAVLVTRPELVDRPLKEASAAESQGRSAAALIALACVLTAVAWALLSSLKMRAPRLRPAFAGALLALAAIGVTVLVIAAHPVARFESFKKPPPALEQPSVREHLFSGSGSGRWQVWTSAVDAFEDRPVLGQGAGSFEAWWAQHGALATFVRDAHSLYLETLAELGLLGFLVLAAFVGAALAGAALRLRRARDPAERSVVAALTAVFLAFLFEAGIDWMWEVTAVTSVAMACLGLLLGHASRPAVRDWRERRDRARERRALALRTAALLVGIAVIAFQAIPLLVAMKIEDSREAAADGDPVGAIEEALGARSLQPWASSPYLQLSLVAEETGNLDLARGWIDDAIARDPRDWRLWLVGARIDTRLGLIDSARERLRHAIELNPRSPLFAG
jgi:tetratricopeptide (TPR) repeat protein